MITTNTQEEEFKDALKSTGTDLGLTNEDVNEVYRLVRIPLKITFLRLIFYLLVWQMLSEAMKKQETEKRRQERKQRHMQDDLRYALKKIVHSIDLNGTYEDVRICVTFFIVSCRWHLSQAIPLMEDLQEFKALEDEGRRAAFAKFVKKQKVRLSFIGTIYVSA